MLAPLIVVGCGGSGMLSTRFIRDEVRARLKARGIDKIPQAWQFIGLDTVKAQTDLHLASPLPAQDFLSLTSGIKYLHELEDVIKARHSLGTPSSPYRELIGWRPDPKDLPGNVELGAGQVRAVGRVLGTFSLNQSQIKSRFSQALTAVQAGGAELATVSEQLGYSAPVGGANLPPIVVVIGSSAGGTGAGVMLDVVDVLKRTDGLAVDPIIVVYGPDIFKEQTPAMAANSLLFMSEMMNAFYSTHGGKTGIFPNAVNKLVSRGPGGIMMIGRKNLSGQDLEDSKLVYRAVGLAIAGWTTTPRVRMEVQDHVLATWRVWAKNGGVGFADSELKGAASSFGSASVSIGRTRFKSYARAYLMRDLYEHHSIGFFKLAESLLGMGKSRGADEKIKLDLVNHFKPDYIRELGLNQSFDKDFAIKSGPDAQVSDALLSRQKLNDFAIGLKSKLIAALPEGNNKGPDWRRLLDEQERRLLDDEARNHISDYSTRQAEWCQQMAEQVIVVTNDYLARATLPVMGQMVPQVISHIQSIAADFKNAAVKAKSTATELREGRNKALNSLGTSNITKQSPGIDEAVTKASQAFSQDLKYEISLKIALTLEQLAMNLFNPLRSSLTLAESHVSEMTVKQLDEDPVVSSWPYADVVPKAFTPSAVEFLLEDHIEWPGILRNLLSNVEGRVAGESYMDAVRRNISVGQKVINGEVGEDALPPMLWLREGNKVEFSSTMPMTLKVELAQADLEDRVDAWLMKEGEISRHLSEGLKTYLQDESSTERFSRFKEKFTLALNRAKPLVEIDTIYMQIVYPGYQLKPKPVMEPLPFPDGHPARAISEDLIRTQLEIPAHVSINEYFGDRNVEGVVVTSFLHEPMFPGIFKSFTAPIATHGQAAREKIGDFRKWLEFKRTRTLDEVIPLPESVTRALIRGYAVARVLGMITLDEGHGSVIRTEKDSEDLAFPTPAYAPLGPSATETSILLSFPLVFIDLPTKRDKAFAAYGALFSYGVPLSDQLAPSQFRVANELKDFLDNGKTTKEPLDKQRRAETIKGENTFETRKSEVLAILDDNITYFGDLLKGSFTGEEIVNAQGLVEPESVYVREIADELKAQFEIVRDKVASYTIGSSSTDGRRRA